jgi:membrane-bound lytic murein transglycosylase D
MNYYREYNLTPRKIDMPLITDTIMVNRNINLAQVSEVLDIPLQFLRDLNPQYLREILPGNAAPCPLRLPASYAVKYIDLEDSISNYKANIYLSNSFRVVEPAGRSGAPVDVAGKDRIVHTIRSGENLGSIAARYGVSVRNLQDWNDLNSTRITAGKKLVIYTKKPSQTQTTATGTKASTRQPTPAVASTAGSVTYHIVKEGDTVWSIAQLYAGVSHNDILKWNNLSKNSIIKPGMKLKIMQ